MRKMGIVLLVLLVMVVPALALDAHLFYGQGCPHCAAFENTLANLQEEYPGLIIHEYEVYGNVSNQELFRSLASANGEEASAVPTLFINDRMITGNKRDAVVEVLEACEVRECVDPLSRLPRGNESVFEDDVPHRLTIPIIVGAAAVDAINPCAFAVLLILMAAALSIADKRRALRFGLAFTVAIYISYFLIGLGLFSALQVAGLSHGFYIAMIVLAFAVGLLNIKDFFWYGKGVLMEVPMSWRPKLKSILRSATSPLGAFLIGFVVSLFELPCTGGPYLVILGLLAKEASRSQGVQYLLLYNLVFVLPLLILSFVIYRGLSSTEKLEELRKEKIRVLHLIAGILMLGIGVAMLLTIV